MKLILGTAQFTMKYGINNKYGKINYLERKKIFKICKKNSLLCFDTAASYKNSEKIILEYFRNDNVKIYTKVTKSNINILINNIDNIKNKVECISFHKLSEYFDLKFRQKILRLKKKYKIKKLGVSIYSSDDYLKILKSRDIDIVQLPLNILDRTFLENGFIEKLKKKKIEVHVRSIFFQGLFAMDIKRVQKLFPSLGKQLIKLKLYLKETRMTFNEISLIWINSLKNIDKLIIGVDNSRQLLENLNILKKKKEINNLDKFISKLRYKNIKEINISKW